MRLVKILGSVLAVSLAMVWAKATWLGDAGVGREGNPEQPVISTVSKELPFEELALGRIEPDELLQRAFIDRDDRELRLVMESLAGEKAEAVERLLRRWDTEGNESQARFARDILVSWGKNADSIDAIRQALSDDDRQVRIAGCRRLSRMGPQAIEAQAELEDCLEHSSFIVRMYAIEAVEATRLVATLPKVRECMRSLDFQNLESIDLAIRAARAVAMLDESDTDSVRVLNDIALKCDVDFMRDVLRALEDIGPQSIHAKDGLARLFVAGDSQSRVTLCVRMTLGHMRESASEIMLEWLSPRRGTPALRRRTLEYLSAIRPTPNMYMREAVDVVSLYEPIAKYLHLSDEENQSLVIKSLINIERRTKRQLATSDQLTKVMSLLDADSEELRADVAGFLGRRDVKYSELVAPVLRKLMQDKSVRVRAAAADGLARHRGDDNDTRIVIDACLSVIEEVTNSSVSSDRNTQVDRNRAGSLAAGALERMGGVTEADLPRLLKLLPSRFGEEIVCAVASLGSAAVPQLLTRLEREDWSVRSRSANALGLIGDKRAVQPLAKLLETDETLLALSAFSRMPQHCDPLIPRLVKLAEDEGTRDAALAVLTKRGPKAKSAIPLLLEIPVRSDTPLDDISQSAAISARAIAQIGQGTDNELAGIRKVLKAIGSGYSWRYKFSSHENPGYSQVIDLIVKLDERALPLVPELRVLVEDHELLHPVYRFEAAYALAQLQPSNLKWREHFNRLAASMKGISQRGHIYRARLKQLEER